MWFDGRDDGRNGRLRGWGQFEPDASNSTIRRAARSN